MQLRPYQNDLIRRMQTGTHVLGVLPTGAGKSRVIASLAAGARSPLVLAHRREIVRQLSEIVPGRVCSVDACQRGDHDLVIVDEAHHALSCNKWGAVLRQYPDARWYGLTATPARHDGRALDLWRDLIVGAEAEELIAGGYLQQPQVIAPTDWSKRGSVVGSVVESYLRHAPGCLGMTFAASVRHGRDLVAEYERWGVPCRLVTAGMTSTERDQVTALFRGRRLLQLVNVDIYGEGTDVPDLEVVSMARPTESLAVYRQQAGRVMRPGGRQCLIIDHVGNTFAHGLPWHSVCWTLDGTRSHERDRCPLRACESCTRVYDRLLIACPYCDHVPEPASRSDPRAVSGDLTVLSPAALAQIQAEIARVDGPGYFGHLSPAAAIRARRLHGERQQAQVLLRRMAGVWMNNHSDQRYGMRKFYDQFGVDVLTIKTLGKRKALELAGRIARGK